MMLCEFLSKEILSSATKNPKHFKHILQGKQMYKLASEFKKMYLCICKFSKVHFIYAN